MTLQLLHSKFPDIWGKYDFLFYHCVYNPRPGYPVGTSVVKNSHIIHDDLRNLQMTNRVVTSMNSSLSRLETSSSSLRNQNSSPSVSYSPLGLEVTEMRKRQFRIWSLGALERDNKKVTTRIETELPPVSLVFTFMRHLIEESGS